MSDVVVVRVMRALVLSLLLTFPSDLYASFDFVRYSRPNVPEHLRGQSFSNANRVSNADLLTFLGESGDTTHSR